MNRPPNPVFSSKIRYLVGDSRPKLLKLECQREGECPAAYTPLCVLSGYVGTIRDPSMSERSQVEEVILIGEQNNATIKVRYAVLIFFNLHALISGMFAVREYLKDDMNSVSAFNQSLCMQIGPSSYSSLNTG